MTTPGSRAGWTSTLAVLILLTAPAISMVAHAASTSATRDLPTSATCGDRVTVTINVDWADSDLLAMEEHAPSGWDVGWEEPNGEAKNSSSTVKWFTTDTARRTFTYDVIVPATASGVFSFDGTVTGQDENGDEETNPIGGDTELQVDCNDPPSPSFTSDCDGFDCVFDASSTTDPEGDDLTYTWAFGDGATETGSSATTTYTYEEQATYRVTLTVDDGKNTEKTDKFVTIDVNDPPTPRFTSTCDERACSFDASDSSDPDGDEITSYSWDLGDGTTATGQTVDHTFSSDDDFPVTLTVSDGELNDSLTKTITAKEVNDPPVAAFSFSCDGLDCSFDASSSSDEESATGDLSFSWDFGGDGTGTGIAPAHSFSGQGDWPVQLTVSDGENTDTVTKTVTTDINDPPTASFTFTCDDLTCSFDATGSSDPDGDSLSYSWSFDDGVSGSGATPEHSYTDGDDYTVQVEVTDGEFSDTASDVVSVQAPDEASIDTDRDIPDSAVTCGTSFEVTIDLRWNSADSLILWDSAPDGWSVASPDNNGRIQDDGRTVKWFISESTIDQLSYTVTVADDAAGSGFGFSGQLRDNTMDSSDPDAPVRGQRVLSAACDGAGDDEPTEPENNAPVGSFSVACSDLTCSLDASDSSDPDGDSLTFTWDFGDGDTGTGATTSHTYDAAGDKTVQLTVSDGDLSDQVTKTASPTEPEPENGAPVGAFSINCTDLTCDLDASSSSDPDGDSLTFTWDFGDGDTGTGATTSHTYDAAGDKTVQLTVSDGDLSDQVTKTASPTEPDDTDDTDSGTGGGGGDGDGNTSDGDTSDGDTSDGDGTTGESKSNDTPPPENDAARVEVVRELPDGPLPCGEPVRINLHVDWNGAGGLIVVEDLPDGWQAQSTTHNGRVSEDQVKWFLADTSISTLSYQIVPDGSTTEFDGIFRDNTMENSDPDAVTIGDLAEPTMCTGGSSDVDDDTSEPPNQPPVADLSAVCDELTCSFDATGSSDPDGDALTYTWDLGDGSSSTSQSLDHTYDAEGAYTVTLTVSDGEASDSDTGTVNPTAPGDDNQAPVAAFDIQCTDLDCTFTAGDTTDPDGDVLTFTWKLGDGSTDKGETVSHTYASAGTYPVELTVTDGELSDTATGDAQVSAPDTGSDDEPDEGETTPPPGSPAKALVQRTLPSGPVACDESFVVTLQLHWNGVDSLMIREDIPDGWEAGDPSHSGRVSGDQVRWLTNARSVDTLTYTLVPTDNADQSLDASGTYRDNQMASSDPDAALGGDASVATTCDGQTQEPQNNPPVPDLRVTCEDLTCTFKSTGSTDPDGDELTHGWSLGDGSTGAGSTVTHAYDEAGTYNVELSVSDGSLIETEQTTLTVEDTPEDDTSDQDGDQTDDTTQDDTSDQDNSSQDQEASDGDQGSQAGVNVVRALPSQPVTCGETFTVTLTLTWGNAEGLIVHDSVPDGWEVSSPSDNGRVSDQQVTWFPSDDRIEELTYQVTPADDTSGDGFELLGAYRTNDMAPDEDNLPVEGEDQVSVTCSSTNDDTSDTTTDQTDTSTDTDTEDGTEDQQAGGAGGGGGGGGLTLAVVDRHAPDDPVGCQATFPVVLALTWNNAQGLSITEEIPDGFEVSQTEKGGTIQGDTIRWAISDPSTLFLSYRLTPTDSFEGEVPFNGTYRDERLDAGEDDLAIGRDDTATLECFGDDEDDVWNPDNATDEALEGNSVDEDSGLHPFDANMDCTLDDEELFTLIDAWKSAGKKLDAVLFSGIDAAKQDSYC